MTVTVNGTAATGANVVSGVYNAPASIVAGELLMLVLQHGSAHVVTAIPTGWSLIATHDDGHTSPGPAHSLVYTKIATASEPTTYTWTWDVIPGADVAIFRIGSTLSTINTGAITSSAITPAQVSPWANPGVTTTAANSGIVFIWNSWYAGALTTPTYTSPLVQVATWDGAQWIAFMTLAAAGASGSKSLSDTGGGGGTLDPALFAIEILGASVVPPLLLLTPPNQVRFV